MPYSLKMPEALTLAAKNLDAGRAGRPRASCRGNCRLSFPVGKVGPDPTRRTSPPQCEFKAHGAGGGFPWTGCHIRTGPEGLTPESVSSRRREPVASREGGGGGIAGGRSSQGSTRACSGPHSPTGAVWP